MPGIGTANNVTGNTIRFPVTDLTVSTTYGFFITNGGTGLISNPTSSTTIVHTIFTRTGSDAATADTKDVAVPIIANDQIVITATVAPTFTFVFNNNAQNLALAVGSVVSGTGTTITVTTNAASGWSAWALSANTALNSAASGDTIATTGTVNDSPDTLTPGVEGYVLDVDLTTDGAGGNHVYQIKADFVQVIHTIMAQNPTIEFVLQPFLLFDQGFEYNGLRASTDIRLLFHHNQLFQCYLRMAKTDDFRCNEHQGGQLVYIATSDVPEVIHAIAKKIVKKINKPQALYALDFAVSNAGRIYLVEGNIGPGIDWDVTKEVNEKKSKQLIRRIVKEFAVRKNFSYLIKSIDDDVLH